jgi:hypothetical protein
VPDGKFDDSPIPVLKGNGKANGHAVGGARAIEKEEPVAGD